MGLFKKGPRQATAAEVHSRTNADGIAGGSNSVGDNWAELIRNYDDDGPGFVGFSLDVKALTSSLCDLTVEERAEDGTWAPTEDLTMQQVGALYAGIGESQNDLLYSHIRAIASVGECYVEITDHPETGGIAYRIVQANQLGQTRTEGDVEYVVVRDDPNAKEGDNSHWRLVPVAKLQRVWWPDPRWPARAWSPLKRTIPDVERYLALVRSTHGAAVSRILNGGMVWLAEEAATAYGAPRGDKPGRNFHTDWSRHGRKALTRFSTLEEHIPMSLSTPNEYGPPQVVDFGRDVTTEELEAQELAVKAVARGLDLPQKLLTDGPGEGNHWSDWLMSADTITTSIKPTLERQLSQLDQVQLRPLIAALSNAGRIAPYDPARFRYGADFSEVTRNPDESETALRYYMAGIMSRKAAGRRGMSLGDEEFMDLDDEETDWWETHHGRGNSREFGSPLQDVEQRAPAPLPTAGPTQSTGGPPVLAGSATWTEWD